MRIEGRAIFEELGTIGDGLVARVTVPSYGGGKNSQVIASDVIGSNGQFLIDFPGDLPEGAVISLHANSSESEPIVTAEAPIAGGRMQLVVPRSTDGAPLGGMVRSPFPLPQPIASLGEFRVRTANLAKSRAAATMLLANPKASITDGLFVAPGGSIEETKAGAIERGIGRMGVVAEHITPAVLIDNGELSAEGLLDPSVPDVDLAGKIRDLIGAIPKPPAEHDCLVQAAAVSAAIVEAEGESAASAGPTDTPPTTEPTDSDSDAPDAPPDTEEPSPVDTLSLLKRLESILGEASGVPGAKRPDPVSLREDLNTEIAGGPADATAYHDFHTLHIAWEDVWTSLVDGKAADALRRAYEEAVKIQIGDDGVPDLSEIAELEQAVDAIRDAVAVRLSASTEDVESANGDGEYRTRRNILVPAEETSSTTEEGRLVRLLSGVEEALKKGYRFDVFAPKSYNYGVLVSYRQRWQPLSYQVGDLVGSVPMAPGQKQTVVSRAVVKHSRAETEARRSVASRSFEDSSVTRADSEIVRKATSASNFAMSAETSVKASVKMLEAGATRSMQYGSNQSKESAESKKHFREAVRKAASEYRDERSVEVSTSQDSEVFAETTTELSNPNNELTITYLFYELQRRFYVDERLNSVTPIVMVALDVPTPGNIDEAWLLEHDWIIRRVLLDDSYVEALDLLTEGLADAEIAVDTLQAVLQGQAALVRELQMDIAAQKATFDEARTSLSKASKKKVRKDGFFKSIGEALFGGADEGQNKQVNVDAARQLLEWSEADLASLSEEMRSSANTMQQAARDYLAAVKDLQTRRLSVDRLRLHVRQNILYYMQAIWAHTPPDQLYFELYDQKVVWPETSGPPRVVGRRTVTEGIDENGDPIEKELVEYRYPPPEMGEDRPLREVADIDRILGFKGNYVIFALRESNAVTDVMMQPYRRNDSVFDPDPARRFNPMDPVKKIKCAAKNGKLASILGRNRGPEDFRDLLQILNGEPDGEMVIVPSGSLFIEALPGARPLLEDFKLKHREIDAGIAGQKLVGEQLENLRWAARLSEGMRSDPENTKSVAIGVSGSEDVDVDIDVP